MGAITTVKQIAYNRSFRTGAIKYIVVHDTGNTGKGANAISHFNYFNGGDRGSSADVFVDDTQTLQVNDWNKYYTWHCGDGRGAYGITNANSIGVEMCINSDGNYEKAFARTVEVVKYLMGVLNIPASRVVRHYDASRKNCPASMSGNGWAKWLEFERRITESEDLTMTQYEELKQDIAELKAKTGYYNYIDENMNESYRPTIQKLVGKSYLRGNENGELMLTTDMMRILTILDRAGVFG